MKQHMTPSSAGQVRIAVPLERDSVVCCVKPLPSLVLIHSHWVALEPEFAYFHKALGSVISLAFFSSSFESGSLAPTEGTQVSVLSFILLHYE